jgi:MerR family transcriptional regulator, light-induced transcriptional regulator
MVVYSYHVCSNIANGLIHSFNDSKRIKAGKSMILICSPEGEIHHIAADVLASILLRHGYKVHNAAPSLPADSIARFLAESSPRLVMISVILVDNLRAAKRLVKEIRKSYQIQIIVGGAAVRILKEEERNQIEKAYKISVVTESSLEKVLQFVKIATSA